MAAAENSLVHHCPPADTGCGNGLRLSGYRPSSNDAPERSDDTLRRVRYRDRAIQLSMGATEIGQGADTVFTQMAAETTGISVDRGPTALK